MASYQKSPSERSDLTDGSVWKGILKFALPLLAGSLFQQLYTTADGIIVGRFAGASALAAIDGVYSLTKLPVNFLTGLSSGATVLLAQYFGARETEKIRQGAHAAFVLALIGGSLLAILGVGLAPWCVRMIRVPDDIYRQSLIYVRLYFAGLAFAMLYNMGAGVFRAAGDSRTPFLHFACRQTGQYPVGCGLRGRASLGRDGNGGDDVAGAMPQRRFDAHGLVQNTPALPAGFEMASALPAGNRGVFEAGTAGRDTVGAVPDSQYPGAVQHQPVWYGKHCGLGGMRQAGFPHLADLRCHERYERHVGSAEYRRRTSRPCQARRSHRHAIGAVVRSGDRGRADRRVRPAGQLLCR